VRGSGVAADLERIVNRIKSKVRSRVEHVFGPLVVPCGIEAQNHWSSSSPVGMWAGCI